ncbi:MAG: sialate O-acetylesterase, partial [Oscillospiraceae bacterium]|nr:sialate O-acetylesterase [Oscillospiraceae bacterium]
MSVFSCMRLFGDDMVLQSGAPNTLRGKAPAGAVVTASISDGILTDEIGRTTADESGSWSLVLPQFPPSFISYTLTLSCGEDTLTARNVLFGELYHISGQSNMELPLSRTIDPLNVQIPPDNEYIREFRVPVVSTFGMDEEYDDFLGGEWKRAVGDDIMSMSGVGYWFASELIKKLDVPVGFVNTSAGGAPCESRLPYKTLMRLGGYDEFLYQCTVPGYQQKTAAADAEKYRRWSTVLDNQDKISDSIFSAEHEYKKCTMPFYFRDVPGLDGLCGRVWFRKTFVIPDGMPTDDAVLVLGTMIDADKCYVNGEYVGETGYMYPPRIYKVPASLLRHGENTIHIRLEVRTGKGGFVKGKKYCLKLGDDIIDLSGEWEYIIAAKDGALTPDVFFQGLPL